jgi:hypothetical protein
MHAVAPVFVPYEELTGRSFRVFYHDDDPNRVLHEGRPHGRGLASAPARHGR